jgi:transposase
MRFIRELSLETQKMLFRIYKESKYHQSRQRAKCIILSFQGLTIQQLMTIFGVSRKTLYNWLTAWEDEKLVGLYDRKGKGRKSKLKEEEKEQVKNWTKEDPKNLKRVVAKVKEELGINISKDTVKRIIKKYQMGWKRMKRGLRGKADKWELEIKLPLLEELKE